MARDHAARRRVLAAPVALLRTRPASLHRLALATQEPGNVTTSLARDVVRSEGDAEEEQEDRQQEQEDPEEGDERRRGALARLLDLMEMLGLVLDLQHRAAHQGKELPVERAGMRCGVPPCGHAAS